MNKYNEKFYYKFIPDKCYTLKKGQYFEPFFETESFMELMLEIARLKYYTDKISRTNCVFATETIESLR